MRHILEVAEFVLLMTGASFAVVGFILATMAGNPVDPAVTHTTTGLIVSACYIRLRIISDFP